MNPISTADGHIILTNSVTYTLGLLQHPLPQTVYIVELIHLP